MSTRDEIAVVAALIRDESGNLMIFQRPAGKTRWLLWEFVGGKVEAGETKEAALIRECREEIGVTVAVGRELMELRHEYPDITIRLSLFEARITHGTPQKLEHEDIRAVSREDITAYDFCPADAEIVRMISEGLI